MALSRDIIVRRNRLDLRGRVVGEPMDDFLLVQLRDDSQLMAPIASVRLTTGQYLADLPADRLVFEPE